MAPRGWVGTTLLVATTVLAIGGGVAHPAGGSGVPLPPAAVPPPTPAPAPPPPPSPSAVAATPDLPARPPPRQPAAAVNLPACLAAYRATGDARAYLCCVDRSMGFCVGWLEAAADGALCTVDWARADRDGGGRQCCFRARRRWVAAAAATTGGGGGGGGGALGLVRPPVGVDGTYGAGVAPALDVDCRASGWCDAAARTRPTPGGGGGGTEAVTRCGSWAPAVYRRCQVTACRSAKVPRLVLTPRVKPGGVPFCGPREFGTPALCCLRKKNYWERARCCAKCRGPAVHGKSNGCCWPGKPPKGGKKAPAKQKPAPRRTWRSGRHL